MRTNITPSPSNTGKDQRLDPPHKIALALLAVLAVSPCLWFARHWLINAFGRIPWDMVWRVGLLAAIAIVTSILLCGMIEVTLFDVRILCLLALTRREILMAIIRVSACIILAWTGVLLWNMFGASILAAHGLLYVDGILIMASLMLVAVAVMIPKIPSDRVDDLSRIMPVPWMELFWEFMFTRGGVEFHGRSFYRPLCFDNRYGRRMNSEWMKEVSPLVPVMDLYRPGFANWFHRTYERKNEDGPTWEPIDTL